MEEEEEEEEIITEIVASHEDVFRAGDEEVGAFSRILTAK